MQGTYLGGYPWKNGGTLTAADLNAAIALALAPVSIIPPGSITNSMLASPWVQIGTTQIQLGVTVNTLSGVLDPVNDLDVANKHYVDQFAGTGGGGGGIPDAPADGLYYTRHNSAWAAGVPLAGGVTITGALTTSGRFTTNGGLTVVGGGTVNGLLTANNGITAVTPGSAGLPNTTGTTQAASLIERFADTNGAVLDIGSNGSSGMWLSASNQGDLSQHYALLLQPVGGETRAGGALTVTGNISGAAITASGALTAASLSLTTPLPIASGGTNSAAQPLPANLAGGPSWAGVALISTGTALRPNQFANGYVATAAGFDVNLVAAAAPSVRFIRVDGTLAAPIALTTNDLIGSILWDGWNSGNTLSQTHPGAIQVTATQAWTPSAMGTQMQFWTTPNNFNTPQVTLTLGQDGSATVRGNISTSGAITATGAIAASGNLSGGNIGSNGTLTIGGNTQLNGQLIVGQGISVTNGRIISTLTGTAIPSVSVWSQGQARACGMYLDSAGNFTLGNLDGNGNPAGGSFAYFTTAGNMVVNTSVTVNNGSVNANNGTIGGVQLTGGNVIASAGLYAANNTNFGLAAQTGANFFTFGSGWYWTWNTSNGDLIWNNAAANAGFLAIRATSNQIVNNLGPMAGVGPYLDYSDERAKTNIADAGIGLDEVLKLAPIRFNRQDRSGDIGFGAQQVASVIPAAVREISIDADAIDRPLGVLTTPIIAACVNAIKALHARIEVLEGRAA